VTTGATGPGAPSDGPPDRLTIVLKDNPLQQRLTEAARGGADAPLAAQVWETVRRIGGAGEGADAAYEDAVRQLGQHNGADVARFVEDRYRELPEEWYVERWALVKLIADLAPRDALSFLDEILSTFIPPERFPQAEEAHPHGFSSVMEEVIIRTTAVEGLRRLFAAGVTDARRRMLDHAGHENFSVRRALVMALRKSRVAESTLRRRFGRPGDEVLLRIKRMDVAEVLQPTVRDVPGRGPSPPPGPAVPRGT
jgi:hypothetical protein